MRKVEYIITYEEPICGATKRMKEDVMDVVVANDVARDKGASLVLTSFSLLISREKFCIYPSQIKLR